MLLAALLIFSKGALFALEVLHTMGMQFFDVAIYAVGAGGVCLAVYRGMQGDGFGAIWNFPDSPQSSATEVILGALVGAIAGGVGIAFRRCARSTAQSARCGITSLDRLQCNREGFCGAA